MNRMLTFMLTFACALIGASYKSDLHENVQAVFFEKAERAYQDIIAYDEDAPITRKDIYVLYAKNAIFAPVSETISAVLNKIDSRKPQTPEKYAEKCIYLGEILKNPPEGVIFVNCYLYPFTSAEMIIYDSIQKSGEKQALDVLFSPLESRVMSVDGVFTPENGFEPYFKMKDAGAVIPVIMGARFLTEEASAAALALSEENPVSPPVRDARGVIVFEFVSD